MADELGQKSMLETQTQATLNPGDVVRLLRDQLIASGRQFKAGTLFRVCSVFETSIGPRANVQSVSDGGRICSIPLDRVELVRQQQKPEESV